MKNDSRLTASEVRLARQRGIFTVTSETERGYYVTLLRLKDGQPERLGRSRECVRPRTARRYGEQLVRAALAS